jgi:Raf kinase inhibitor-like YbhB/YbcL family protein
LEASKTEDEVRAAMQGHELGNATLTGVYSGDAQSGSNTGSEQTGSNTGSEQTGSNTGSEQTGSSSSTLTLTSSAFNEGATLPNKYAFTGCYGTGENYSPPLSWSGAPAGTKSFAILMTDLDSQNAANWVQFNIPGETTSLAEVVGGPDIGIKGTSAFGDTGYGDLCPLSADHKFAITVYALDSLLSLQQGAYKEQVLKAMDGHKLGEGQLTGFGDYPQVNS